MIFFASVNVMVLTDVMMASLFNSIDIRSLIIDFVPWGMLKINRKFYILSNRSLKRHRWLYARATSATNFLDQLWLVGEPITELEGFKEVLEMNNVDGYIHGDDDFYYDGYEKCSDLKDKFKNKHGDGIFHFVQCLLDYMEFIEHGSSVGNAWLTSKGEQLLKELRKK